MSGTGPTRNPVARNASREDMDNNDNIDSGNADAIVDAIEGFILEDDGSYRKTVGRWIRETNITLHSRAFWITLELAHISRSPLDH